MFSTTFRIDSWLIKNHFNMPQASLIVTAASRAIRSQSGSTVVRVFCCINVCRCLSRSNLEALHRYTVLPSTVCKIVVVNDYIVVVNDCLPCLSGLDVMPFNEEEAVLAVHQDLSYTVVPGQRPPMYSWQHLSVQLVQKVLWKRPCNCVLTSSVCLSPLNNVKEAPRAERSSRHLKCVLTLFN